MLIEFVKKNSLKKFIVSKDYIVVGFSGGPDSVFLVEMLLGLRKYIEFDMVLVHINHLLRGKNSDDDEKFSIKYAEEKGLKIFTKKIDVKNLSIERKITLEEAGRDARYNFYNEILEKIGGNKIALAHNKDDQIETFIFRLIRGSSIEGLQGIKERHNSYIRPISDIYKKKILNYLEENCIKYRIDESNLENEFTRNSIRLDLIPFIEKRYNPKFKDKIYDLIGDIKNINKFFDEQLKNIIMKPYLDIKELKILTKYLRGRVFNGYLNRFGIKSSRAKIKLIEDMILKGGTRELKLSDEFVLKKEYEKISIMSSKNVEKSVLLDEQILKIPGTLRFGEYLLEAVINEKEPRDKNCFYCKLLKENEIKVRTKKDGDRIQLVNTTYEKKLKEIFINEKVPKDLRDKIPLLVYKNEIVWISGIRGSEKFIEKENLTCIKFSIRRIV